MIFAVFDVLLHIAVNTCIGYKVQFYIYIRSFTTDFWFLILVNTLH